MIRRALPLGAIFAVLLAIVGTGTSARAAATFENITVDNSQAPKQLTFKVTLSAPADVTEATLRFRVAGRASSGIGQPADPITPARNLTVSVVVQTNTAGNYIPVGSDITDYWRVQTADGQTTESPDAKFTYLPAGTWRSVGDENVIVYFQGDREAIARSYVAATTETLDKMATGVLGTALRQKPVKAMLFSAERDLEQARAGGPTTHDQSVTNCGTKVSVDVIHLIHVQCGSPDITDTFRHELTHILTQAAGSPDLEGALYRAPSWLDEGTAMYGQTGPGQQLATAQAAARGNRLIPFSQINLANDRANTTELFYGQSYLMVKFLIDRAGPAKFAELFATMKKGVAYETAMKTVYGFDMTGFEKEFLASVGATGPAPTVAPTTRPAGSQPTAAPTTRGSGAQPTAAPTRAPAQDTGDDNSIDGMAIGIFGAAILFGLLGVMAFLISMVLQNNRKRAAAAGASPSPGDHRPRDD